MSERKYIALEAIAAAIGRLADAQQQIAAVLADEAKTGGALDAIGRCAKALEQINKYGIRADT